MERPDKQSEFLFSPDVFPVLIKVSVIIFATFAIFFPDFALIFNDAISSDINNYALIVPFIFVFLLYRKRRILRALISVKEQKITKQVKYLSTVSGILLFIASILFYWFGSYTVTPLELHLLVLPIFIAGLILILFNVQTIKQMIFPLAFLFFLVPPPQDILYALGNTLSGIGSQISYGIIKFLGVPATFSSEYGNPTIIITQPNNAIIPFSVDIACSGVYSLIGFFTFATFVAYIIRDKLPKKLALFIIGFPLIYLLNVARITSILLIGYQFGEKIALEIFHLLSGWILIFLGTILLLVISEKILHIQLFTKDKVQDVISIPTRPKKGSIITQIKMFKPKLLHFSKIDVIKIVAITLSIVFIISIQVPVFALTKDFQIEDYTSSGQVPKQIIPDITGYFSIYNGRDIEFEDYVNLDYALWYIYLPVNQSGEQKFETFVGLEVSQTWSSMHSLYYCLNEQPILDYGQPKVRTLEYKDVHIMQNPPIVGKYFVFKNETTNELQASLWWYETFYANSTLEQKIVKTTLISYPSTEDDLFFVENQLLSISTQIADYWQPIKLWSPIALFLAQNGFVLVILIIIMQLGVVGFYFFSKRNELKKYRIFYDKLSDPNKQMFKTVYETEKKMVPTFNNISLIYSNLFKTPVEESKLVNDLNVLEKIGLIKLIIENINDQPISVWRTQIRID